MSFGGVVGVRPKKNDTPTQTLMCVGLSVGWGCQSKNTDTPTESLNYVGLTSVGGVIFYFIKTLYIFFILLLHKYFL